MNIYNGSQVKPPLDKTNKMACAPREDSDQPGHPPSLIRVFAVCMKKDWVLSYPLSPQRRLSSDWVDAQADLSLCWAHSHCVGFVMRWPQCFKKKFKTFHHLTRSVATLETLKGIKWSTKSASLKAIIFVKQWRFRGIQKICFCYSLYILISQLLKGSQIYDNVSKFSARCM